VAINDTYFFTCQGTLSGRNYVHTLHFREGATVPLGNPAQDLINTWQTSCQTPWLAIHPAAYTLVRLTAQKVCGALPLPSRVEEGVGAVGTRVTGSSSGVLAPWLCIAVNEATGLAGKSRHGRFFVSGGYEDDIVGETLATGAGSWLATTQLYLTALTTAFVAPADPFKFTLVVHSRTLADVPGTQCQNSSEPVTSLGAVARLTTQRSRRA
jgi:hypothetical protein